MIMQAAFLHLTAWNATIEFKEGVKTASILLPYTLVRFLTDSFGRVMILQSIGVEACFHAVEISRENSRWRRCRHQPFHDMME